MALTAKIFSESAEINLRDKVVESYSFGGDWSGYTKYHPHFIKLNLEINVLALLSNNETPLEENIKLLEDLRAWGNLEYSKDNPSYYRAVTITHTFGDELFREIELSHARVEKFSEFVELGKRIHVIKLELQQKRDRLIYRDKDGSWDGIRINNSTGAPWNEIRAPKATKPQAAAEDIKDTLPQNIVERAPLLSRGLRLGTEGNDIRVMQQRLVELGYLGADGKPLIVDGKFGPNTLFAVNAFKNANMPGGNTGVNEGVVGQDTWKALFSSKALPFAIMAATTGGLLSTGFKAAATAHQALEAAKAVKAQKLSGKVFHIDVGHGDESGATGRLDGIEYQERHLALDISLRLKKELEAQGAIVSMSHEDITQAVNYSNRNVNIGNPDLIISVHLNSNSDTSIKGLEVLYTNKLEANYKVAEEIRDSFLLNTSLGLNDNPLRLRTDLFILNTARSPAINVEAGYISNNENLRYILDNPDKLAEAIAKGVTNYYK